MGILATLDSYKNFQSGMLGEYPEVEFQLHSWGEIYPPFIGDREHSIAARFILRDFPIKLFSSSTPYDDPLPQKLCLSFIAPYQVKKNISGIFSHETAKEFAAFLSLVTRRRVFVTRQIRYDGLPIEHEIDLYRRSHFQEMQRLKEINPKQIYQLLENLQTMDRSIADGFIMAMRLYHSAVEMIYTEPEFSYLFLIICLETISSVVYKDYKPPEEEKFLDSRFPGWKDLSNVLPQEQKMNLKEMLLKNEKFTFSKFSKFIEENVPERFWSETKDDAKPDYLIGKFGLGPNRLGQEHISHSDITIGDWEKIEKESLTGVLREIYNARSKLIHEGVRLPASIVFGHFRWLPPEASQEIIQSLEKNHVKHTLPIPPLLTFERLVSYSMVEFLHSQRPEV